MRSHKIKYPYVFTDVNKWISTCKPDEDQKSITIILTKYINTDL